MSNSDRYEINHDCEIVVSESAKSENVDVLIQDLFSQNNWTFQLLNKESCYRKIKVTSPDKTIEYSINLFVGNIRNESRNSMEKKIQLNTMDPRQYKDGMTIILGFYVFNKDDKIKDSIIVGYPVKQDINYPTNPSLRRTFVNKILIDAKVNGISIDNENQMVAFRPEFIFYYLQNYKALQGYNKSEANNQQNTFIGKIPRPLNRIVFGAPGTGKSNRLSDESKQYFISDNAQILKNILIEIKDLLQQGNDMGHVAMLIGIKYMNFFSNLLQTKTQDEITTEIGITDDILGTHARSHMFEPAKTVNNNTIIDYSTMIERVTFHPNYSYSQFVGTYKPTMKNNKELNDTQKKILNVLNDNTKTAQEKYDLLYEDFKGDSLTRLPILLGLYNDDLFHTKKTDGSSAANDNMVERNHGKAIRPYVNLTNSGNEDISYEFVPGPFIRTFIKAKKTGKNCLLLIEEINRANVAAVFGDVFQLLDRDAYGNSEYPITTSEDLRNFLAKKENLGGKPEDYETISIPSNMYIWATMNSADQGVFPMDTAFKRRWEFEYIGIDDNKDKVIEYIIPINKKQTVNWNEIRTAINDKLIELGVNEDKLLGPFFLSKNVLDNALNESDKFIKLFESKVIMYLFEDAAKMKRRELFNLENGKYIYSEICKYFEDENYGLKVFKFNDNVTVTDIPTETSEDKTE